MGNINKKSSTNNINKIYDFAELLGQGSFGVVNKAYRKKDNLEVAIKTIRKVDLSPEELSNIEGEVNILRKVKHPNCVNLIEVYESPKNIYIVMDLLTGGELFDRIVEKSSFNEQEAAKVVKQIASALLYLHNSGIVHRDLKPENLLYSTPAEDSPIKITDFGLAKKREKNQLLHTACGTPAYVAPEVLRKENYGKEVDLWSLGVVLYIILCGFPPFFSDNSAELFEIIKAGRYTFLEPYWNDISAEAKDLVRGLLNVDPKKRYTCEQVLNHPWVATEGVASTKLFGQDHNRRLKLLQAKRKLRRCVQVLLAANRLSGILQAAVANASPHHDSALAPQDITNLDLDKTSSDTTK